MIVRFLWSVKERCQRHTREKADDVTRKNCVAPVPKLDK
jgi:hypothetical protein